MLRKFSLIVMSFCLLACGSGIEQKINGQWHNDFAVMEINTKDKTIAFDMAGMVNRMLGKELANKIKPITANAVKYDVKKNDGDSIVLNLIAPDGRMLEMTMKMQGDDTLLVMENGRVEKLTRIK